MTNQNSESNGLSDVWLLIMFVMGALCLLDTFVFNILSEDTNFGFTFLWGLIMFLGWLVYIVKNFKSVVSKTIDVILLVIVMSPFMLIGIYAFKLVGGFIWPMVQGADGDPSAVILFIVIGVTAAAGLLAVVFKVISWTLRRFGLQIEED